MNLTFDDDVLTEEDVMAVAKVRDLGLVQHGDVLTRAKLADLLGCRHNGGKHCCATCANPKLRRIDG